MRILLTGATGFVGRALLKRFARQSEDIHVRLALRGEVGNPCSRCAQIVVGDISGATNWREALVDIDVVVHLAARVHVVQETERDPLKAFRKVNVVGSLNLATQAAEAGVRRFVFLSSIKVNGEGDLRFSSHGARVYREQDLPAPMDAYGTSKHEAELGLWEIAARSGMELVVIRPPLVYGPGVKANFRSLLRLVDSGMILPFGAVDNRRSFVAVSNLADFICTCVQHRRAANETFLISDDDDVSTPELIRRLSRAMGRQPRLVAVPPTVIYRCARLFGKRDLAQRLLASLQLDIYKAKTVLGWRPCIDMQTQLDKVVADFRLGRSNASLKSFESG